MTVTKGLILAGILFVSTWVPAARAQQATAAQSSDRRPNVVIILADDMGYADIGAFGSEIKTPSMDSLTMSALRTPPSASHPLY